MRMDRFGVRLEQVAVGLNIKGIKRSMHAAMKRLILSHLTVQMIPLVWPECTGCFDALFNKLQRIQMYFKQIHAYEDSKAESDFVANSGVSSLIGIG